MALSKTVLLSTLTLSAAQFSVFDPTPSPDPTPAPAPAPDPTTPAPSPANETTSTPEPAPSGGVKIQSKVSSFCVDLPGGDSTNGKHLWMWECYDGVFQQWEFEDGRLKYSRDKTKCVDLLGDDTTNGNQLGIWDCYPTTSQQWGYDPEWGTIYLASSTASDATKCVQIGGQEQGDPLVIWDCTIEPYQIWAVNDTQPSLAVV